MTWIGVGGVVLGGALVTAGTTFVSIGQKRLRDHPANIRFYREPGIALLATGFAVVVSGAALLIFDRVRPKKKKRVAFTPVLSTLKLGFQVSMAF